MAYEYKVPYVDFVNDFNENDDADEFFELNMQIGKLQIETNSSCTSTHSDDRDLNGPQISTSGFSETVETCSSSTVQVSSTNALTDDSRILSPSGESCPSTLSVVSESAASSVSTVDREGSVVMSQKTEKESGTILKEITDKALNITNFQENRKRKSDIEHKPSKFISLAEGVRDFHIHTPPRFHSCPKGKTDKHLKNVDKIHKKLVTIPQSPQLLSKTRTRPVDYPSAEEREKKEIEEIQSFKLDIHPVDPKIFEPPRVGRRVARPPVVIEPFNLTEFKKKEVKQGSTPFHFKAKPVPKGILEHTIGVPEKKKLPVTAPSTPSFVAKQKLRFRTIEEVDGKMSITEKDAHDIGVSRVTNFGKTLVQPFSFEERDKRMIKHKEEKIKKVLQEEKEARNFQANPIPVFIKKLAKNQLKNSPSPSKNSDEEKRPVFKAQPASVIHKQPFMPRKPERSFTEPDNVLLHTEQRAQRRKEFDEHLKQHFEDVEAEMQRRKELEEKKNQEEVLHLRQQAVHKAQPIRMYKPVPQPDKVYVTSPKSPCFSNRFKK